MKENENYTVNVRIIAPDLPDEFVSAIKKHRPLGDEQDQGDPILPLSSEQILGQR